MLLLNSTTMLLRLTCSAAGDLEVMWSGIDKTGTGPSSYSFAAVPTDLPTNIATATTATIVAAPAASTERNVKDLSVHNAGSAANAVTIEQFDGTDAAIRWKGTLQAGERVVYDETGQWTLYAADGTVRVSTAVFYPNLGIAGTLAETMPRQICPEVNTTVAASGTLFMQAIYLVAGQVISSITLASATTAAGTPTNYAAGLFDANRNLLANTANQTTTAWAANTIKTIALTAQYTVPTSGLYYIGYYMTATTVATLKGGTAKTGGQLAGTAPILHGTSSTGLTTALPSTAAAITVGTATIYAAVS